MSGSEPPHHLMSASLNSDQLSQDNHLPWYEASDSTCVIREPTLIYMGDDRPLLLLFPTSYQESLAVLPSAKKLASEQNALLILMLYGELSNDEMKVLLLELIAQQVVPLFIGESNRRKFNQALKSISNRSDANDEV